MVTRRRFSVLVVAGLATPAVLRAQEVAGLVAEATALPQLHAFLFQRGQDLLVAEAPRGPGLDRLANIKSCSKSLVALLLGSAIDRGEIAALSSRLADVAPDLIPADATEGVPDLTMSDLVTLRAGLVGTSGPNYGAWVASRDWVAHALRQPRVDRAGGRMIYSTGTTHVLGAALATASGQSLHVLARERLGDPLDIEVPPWPRDPQGFYFGGNDMALTPRAMLRVALLLRDGGRFGDRQVIPGGWIAASQRPQTRSPWSGLAYGYGWFLSPGGWTLARGFGGQVIAAHPARGLAVAITSDPTRTARSEGHFGALLDLLDGPVLSAG